MAMRLLLCGSSVYVQKKWSCSFAAAGAFSSALSGLTVKLPPAALRDGTVAVVTEERILGAAVEREWKREWQVSWQVCGDLLTLRARYLMLIGELCADMAS
jgi:hypothetical protein